MGGEVAVRVAAGMAWARILEVLGLAGVGVTGDAEAVVVGLAGNLGQLCSIRKHRSSLLSTGGVRNGVNPEFWKSVLEAFLRLALSGIDHEDRLATATMPGEPPAPCALEVVGREPDSSPDQAALAGNPPHPRRRNASLAESRPFDDGPA